MILDEQQWLVGVGFTGIDQPYESPENPELVLKAGTLAIDECVAEVVQLLQQEVGVATVILSQYASRHIFWYFMRRFVKFNLLLIWK